MTASSSIDSTLEQATFGPVGRSAVEVRRFHLAPTFWLIPWRLASALKLSQLCCIARRTASVVRALP